MELCLISQSMCFPAAGQPSSLAKLAEQINEHHAACETAMKAGLENALQAGRGLAEVKSQLPHGSFGQWLADNFHGSERTAQAYMRVAKRWPEDEAKAQTSADLSLNGALKLLARPCHDFEDELSNLRRQLNEAYTIEDPVEAIKVCLSCRKKAIAIVRQLKTKPFDLLPDLSPDRVFGAVGGRDSLMEISPSPDHAGYYYLAHYTGLDSDHASVVYLGKPVKGTPELLYRILTEGFHFAPVAEWHSLPATGELPWFISEEAAA